MKRAPVAVLSTLLMPLLFPVVLPTHASPISWAGIYEETRGSPDCRTTPNCVVKFSAVPIGKTLLVTDVACEISWKNKNATIKQFVIVPDASPSRRTALSGLTKMTSQTYQSNDRILKGIASGERPLVAVTLTEAAESISVNCSIAGTLHDLQ
jgi:hypothetical protein